MPFVTFSVYFTPTTKQIPGFNLMSLSKQDRFINVMESVLKKAERFALSLTRNRDTAKDILGDAILIVYENFDKIEDKQAILSYVFTIISRLYKQYCKLNRHYVKTEPYELDKLFAYDSPQDLATDVKILYQAMDKLPLTHREVLMLQEIYGFSQKEIARIQNTTIASVKVRVHRAKKSLRIILGADK